MCARAPHDREQIPMIISNFTGQKTTVKTLLLAATVALASCADKDVDTVTIQDEVSIPVQTDVSVEPTVDTSSFDAAPYRVGVKARAIGVDSAVSVTPDGILLTSSEDGSSVIALNKTYPVVAGQSYQATMVFDLLTTDDSTTPMIQAWPLDANGDVLDAQSFTAVFRRSQGRTPGEKTLVVTFDTMASQDGSKVIQRIEDAVSLRFVASPIHGGSNSRALLKSFTVDVVNG